MSKNKSYLFYSPEKFLNKEMVSWLKTATIAHLAPIWLPLPREDRNYGGIEDIILNNFLALKKMGVKKQIIFGNPKNKRMEYLYKKTKVYIPNDIAASDDLLKLMRTDKYEALNLERIHLIQAYNKIIEKRNSISIVHDHTNLGRDLGAILSESIKPVIHTEHGPLLWPGTSKTEEKVLSQYKKKRNIFFVAISKNQKNQMKELNWIGVNHNGVDLEDFHYQEKKDNYLLFLGRINRSKGTHNAIKVAKSLDIPLIIAGSVEETPESINYFEKEISTHIDNKKIFHLENGANATERKELLSKATALLMLIEWDEPFGMVMAEALASGTPVVAFRKGSVPEIIKNGTGFIASNIFEAKLYLKEILRGNYSPKKCRLVAEKYFSKEAMAARYVNLYMKADKKFLSKQPIY